MENEDPVKKLLYHADDDDELGLMEVQLMENPSPERTRQTIQLLSHSDEFVAFQACLILTAWNVAEGLGELRNWLKKIQSEPLGMNHHRIWGYDTSFEMIVEAIDYNYSLQRNPSLSSEINELIGICISTFSKTPGEDRLSELLLKYPVDPKFLDPLEASIEQLIHQENWDQASYLVPVLGRYKSSRFVSYFEFFSKQKKQSSTVLRNLIVSTQYPGVGDELLKRYLNSDDAYLKIVAESVAKKRVFGPGGSDQ